MSPQAKVELGVRAEAMLASWPAPSSDDAAWENRAAKIVAAATNAPRATEAEIAALFAKPALDAEPGEVESSVAPAVNARSASGEKAMSDSNSGSPNKPANSSAAPTSSAVSKRPSLKELAARASQANAAGTPSIRPAAPASLPPPAAESVAPDKQRPSSPSPAIASTKASVPPARPIEATKDDSGRVDLNAINQAATPAQIAAAEAAKPGVHDLIADAGDDKPAPANDTSEGAKVKSISEARAKKAKKKGEAAKTNEAVKATETAAVAEVAKKEESEGGNGKWVAILANLGLAAGGFVMMRNKQQPAAPVATVVQEKPEAAQPAVAQQKIAEAPQPTSTGLSIDSLPTAPPTESAKVAVAPKVVAANPTEEPAAPPPPTADPAAPTALPTATAPNGKPGDLSSAMAQAVGGSTDKPVNADDATPAAGSTGNQKIPEQPPQGSVASAINAVKGNARACVAGADDVSTANVTFSSTGAVSSVSVSGWAASNGKSECVKAALKSANVGPFSKPTFTVSVPIRP